MDIRPPSADETIWESLGKLNAEYPVVDSPSKPGLETSGDTLCKNVPDVSADLPVFDRTPLPDVSADLPAFDRTPQGCPADTADGSVLRGERTAGPQFDSTPFQRDNIDLAVTKSPVTDCTPVLEDTQSQSVDGTEEVTQEHNVQQQLDNYADYRAAKLAAHQESLKIYYARKKLKLKSAHPTEPVLVDGLSEESPGSPSRPKKKRMGVAKKKVLPDGPPRRSPRISPSIHDTGMLHQSSSPGKSRSAKRKLAVDKTYVPDAADEDAFEHDVVDLQAHDDEINRKKRRVDAGPSSGPSMEKQCAKNKPGVTKKPKGRRKKTDDGKEPEKDRFQQTVRCSIGEVRAAAKLLKESHIAIVRDAGFGCVFDWVLEGNVSRVLMCHLMMTIDTSTMKIHCGSGKVLDVNREAVHQVLGFPIGGYAAPFPSDSGHDESLRKFKMELGIDSKSGIESKDLRKILKVLVEDPEKVHLAVKVFFSILYNKLICPGSAPRVGREAAMLVDMNYKKMSQSDYCQLVVDEIKRAAIKYQDSSIPQAGPEGCGLVPTVMYLDSCKSAAYSVMHIDTPRANFLHEKPLEKIYRLDLLKHGGTELSRYKFGKLGWKGHNEIAYSYHMPVEELHYVPRPPSPAGLPGFGPNSEQVDNTQIELVDTQEKAFQSASKHQPPLHRGESSSVSVINQIGQLLQEAEQLSHNIPSTADRLSRISGLFPDGHGPSVEAVKEETEHENKLLDSLRLALSCIQTSFAEFGSKQDAICREYEREAVILEKQFNMQDAVDGSLRDSGLGQSAAEAEEEARMAEEAASLDSHGDDEEVEEDIDVEIRNVMRQESTPVTPPEDYIDGDEDGVDGSDDDIPEGHFFASQDYKGDVPGSDSHQDVHTSKDNASELRKDDAVPAKPTGIDDLTHAGDEEIGGNVYEAALQPSRETDTHAVGLTGVGITSEPHDHPDEQKEGGSDMPTEPRQERAVSVESSEESSSCPEESAQDIVSSAYSTPPLSALPIMKKIKEVYHGVIRLRKDSSKSGIVLFSNDDEFPPVTVGHVAEAFRPFGYLCSFTVGVGVYLLGQKYRHSEQLVVPYTCCRHIFEGNLGSVPVSKVFSVDSEDRLDKKDIVLFTTFDPPNPPLPGVVGHFCIICLNIKKERFELLDSLRGPNDPDARRVVHLMARNIKKLWREASNSKGDTFHPKSIDGYRLHYVPTPKQGTTNDCGFFMLQNLNSYDGNGLVIYGQGDIPNIRMCLLYSWLMHSDFNIDMKGVLGIDPGPHLGIDEDDFSLFETQYHTPEVQIIPQEEFTNVQKKVSKEVVRLHSSVKPRKTKKPSSSGVHQKADIVSLDDDDDDFVSDAPWKRRSSRLSKGAQPCSPGSSDDFVTQKPRHAPSENLVISNKRPSKITKKLRVEVPKFIPYKFPKLSKAKEIKELVLSKEYIRDHGNVRLVQFTAPNDDVLAVDGNYMFRLFGRCEMMESEVMEHIISYWKDDPEMKYMFESGERVLLGPYTIPYLLDYAPFTLKDSKGTHIERSSFDVKRAARMFKNYVRDNENLLTAKLIIIPHFFNNHHTVYVMNRYRGTLDIFDSRKYTRWSPQSRNTYHGHRVEIMSRMVSLLKEVYGTSTYNKHNVHQWDVIAERCNFVPTPVQGTNECGFYALRVAYTFDGEKFAEDIKKIDARVEEWKAEYMYQLMFHPKNEISPLMWPDMIQDLILLLGLGSQSSQELLSKAAKERLEGKK